MITGVFRRLYAGRCEGRRSRAQRRQRPVSAWLEAVPAAAHLRLFNAAFLAAVRHHLGLAMPLMAAVPACDCGHEDAALPDHAHVCNAIKGLRTSRHDQQVHALQRVLQRAAAIAASLRRGDSFTTTPEW